MSDTDGYVAERVICRIPLNHATQWSPQFGRGWDRTSDLPRVKTGALSLLDVKNYPSGSRTKQRREPPSRSEYGGRSGSMPCPA